MKFLMVSLFLIVCSCSSTKRQTQADIAMHAPPTDDKVIMPKGAPLVREDTTVVHAERGEEGEIIVLQSDFNYFIDQGPAFVFTHLDLVPSKNSNTMQGYKIAAIGPIAQAYLGSALQANDVLTHINGMPLNTPDEYFKAWQSISKHNKIRLDFIRDTQAQHLIWAIVNNDGDTPKTTSQSSTLD